MKLSINKDERIKYLGFNDLWFVFLGIPALSFLSNALFLGGTGDAIIGSYWPCYGIALVFTTFYWVLSRQIVLQLRHRFPAQHQTNRRIIITGIALFIGVVAISFIAQPLIPKDSSIVKPVSVGYKIIMSFTLVVMVFSIYEGIYFFTKYRQSLLEQERLSKANMQAQLAALKQQINPHFLFNSLNTLANVIPEDTKLATRFVQRLSAVYRRVLEYRHTELVPLKEELNALADYLFLLEIRFENKLMVKLQLPDGSNMMMDYQDWARLELSPTLQNKQLPPLCLQLMVENAVKHNIVSSATPLEVHLQLTQDSIFVKNRLQLKRKMLHSTGIGQQNIRQRYRLLSERPVVIHTDQDWYTVELPLLTEQAKLHYATA